MVRLSVVGCGYLGAVHAACMAALGHQVIGIDTDAAKVAALAAGQAPFYEPGFLELLTAATETGRLRFSTDIAEAADAQVHFVCVGTPQQQHGYAADLTFVDAAVTGLLPYLAPGDVVVGKSTVPVGTAERLAALISAAVPGADLVWNPEFLREGFAVQDTFTPDRFVYGVAAGGHRERSVAMLDEVYAEALAQQIPRLVTDLPTAELVKVAANSFLATKISFINAMAEICEQTGADVTQLADAIGHDDRIGRKFLNAGLGFGGGCLPKDIRAFMARAEELGSDQAVGFLREVDAINSRRRQRMVDLAHEVNGGTIRGRRIAVLGTTFKPNSDDVRDSPALDVAAALAREGADVVVTDPQGIENARRRHPELCYVETVEAAAAGADAVLLLTEWQEYRDLVPERLAEIVAVPTILDGRNVLDPARWRAAGWAYRALGRP